MSSSLNTDCLALQTVGASMSTLLGPVECTKLYLEGGSHDGGLLRDPLQIIEALTESKRLRNGHPTNQLLYESCQGQQREYGCGLTSLVCLAAYWSEGVVQLCQEGLPLPAVLTLYDEGLRLCNYLFTSHAVPVDTLMKSHDVPSRSCDHSRVMSKVKMLSRHFSLSTQTLSSRRQELLKTLSSGLSHGRELGMKLAAEALEKVWSEDAELPGLRSVLTHCVVGKGQSSSQVYDGVLVDLTNEMTVLCQALSGDVNVIVVHGDCSPASRHPGLTRDHMTSHMQQSSSQWLTQCTAALNKFNIGLLVVGGVMSPLLWEHCLAKGIVVLVGVRSAQREWACHISGAAPLFYLQHVKQEHVGMNLRLENIEGGWVVPKVTYNGTDRQGPLKTYSCRISSSHTHSRVVTAMLCGSTETTTDLLSQQFINSLHRLHCALLDGHVLKGGGVFEAVGVATLRKAAEQNTPPLTDNLSSWMVDEHLLSHWRPAVYGALADGLVKYLCTLVRNVDPDIDVYGARTLVEQMVRDGVRCGGCDGVKVYDDVGSKRGAWHRAVSLVRTVCMSGRI